MNTNQRKNYLAKISKLSLQNPGRPLLVVRSVEVLDLLDRMKCT